jgi:hypothetical protein
MQPPRFSSPDRSTMTMKGCAELKVVLRWYKRGWNVVLVTLHYQHSSPASYFPGLLAFFIPASCSQFANTTTFQRFRYPLRQTSPLRCPICITSWQLLCCSRSRWAWSRETTFLPSWHPEGPTECFRSGLGRILVPRKYLVLVEKVLATMLVTILIAWSVFASSITLN